MAISVLSPFGPSNFVFSNIGAVGWSPTRDPSQPPFFLDKNGKPLIALVDTQVTINGITITIPMGNPIPNPLAGGFSSGVTIGDDDLTVSCGIQNQTVQPTNQGATINPGLAAVSSPVTGGTIAIYWEFTLDNFVGNTSFVGVGVCDISALNDYASLAANGTGGIILRPASGLVYGQGSEYRNAGGTLGFTQPFSTGDTIGILVNMDGAGTGMNCTFFGTTGVNAGLSSAVLELIPNPLGQSQHAGPLNAALPVVVFGSPNNFGDTSIFANFGHFIYDSQGNIVPSGFKLQNLAFHTDPSVGTYLGWPAFNIVPPPSPAFPPIFPPPIFPPPIFPPPVLPTPPTVVPGLTPVPT